MSRNKKKHVDITCVKKNNPLKFWKKLGYPPGQFCSYLDEYYPQLERAGCEVVYSGHNNSEVVFGRDRNSSLASGNGGSGGTQCGMIDLVAGRLSSKIRDAKGKEDCDKLTGPNFFADAARIYITQRGDMDTYFGLNKIKKSAIGKSDNASGIGIKADHVRMIGRQTVRIYAGKAEAGGFGRSGEPNSRGGKIETGGVIELVSGESEMHPAVLGTNLILALRQIYTYLKQAFASIHAQASMQRSLLPYLAFHSHAAPGAPSGTLVAKGFQTFGKELMLSFDTMLSNFNITIDEMNKTGVGEPGFAHLPGAKDVLSTKVYLT